MKLKQLNCIDSNININEYIEFIEKVKNNMEHPEWLGDFSKEDLLDMLNNNSKIWMYYLNSEPVCSMMLIPSDERILSKFELNLDYKEVVNYGPLFVHPKYVGSRLQLQMLKEIDEYCVNFGYKYAVSTIHPDNIYSINNLLKDNFEYKNTKNLKRGVRNIYLKKLFSINKILTFIVNRDNKFLLLKGSADDPQFHESFWYVVTGSVENFDKDFEHTVKRETKEETGLEINKIYKLNWIFQYNSLGKTCVEEAFISYVDESNVVLNEESIEYKWCNLDELIDLIKWYSSKKELKNILNDALNNKFMKEIKILKIKS